MNNRSQILRETYKQMDAAMKEYRDGDPFLLVDPVAFTGWIFALAKLAGEIGDE